MSPVQGIRCVVSTAATLPGSGGSVSVITRSRAPRWRASRADDDQRGADATEQAARTDAVGDEADTWRVARHIENPQRIELAEAL